MWRDAGIVLLQGLLEGMMYLPVLLFMNGYMDDSSRLWWMGLLLGYPIGYLLNRQAGYRHPFPILLIAAVIGLVCNLALFGVSLSGFLAAAATACSLYRGARMVGESWTNRFTIGHFGVGIVLYFIYSAIALQLERYADTRTLLLIGGVLALASLLVFTNKRIIEGESNQRGGSAQVEHSVRRLNRSMVAVMLLVAAGIASVRKLQNWAEAIWSQAANWIASLLQRDGGEPPEPLPEPPSQPQAPMLPEGDQGSPPVWLDWIMYGFLILVGLVVLWLLLRRVKYLPRLFRQLKDRIGKLFMRDHHSGAQGYVDEIVELEKPSRFKLWRQRKADTESRMRWSDLTSNREKLRYLYRHWLTQSIKIGVRIQPSLTPMEISEQAATASSGGGIRTTGDRSALPIAKLYSADRYGEQLVDDAVLEQLASELNMKRK